MEDRKRRLLVLIAVMAVMSFLLLVAPSGEIEKGEVMKYYIENHLRDTSSDNAVTAIYLNYRVFDTFFEALLLIISVTGIIHFLEDKGVDDGK